MDLTNLEGEIHSVSRAIGLPICYHDRIGFAGLTPSLTQHGHPACVAVKRNFNERCVAFDVGMVHERLRNMSQGDIHTCPFGFVEIAVPVFTRDLYAGVLFAGPCSYEGGGAGIFVPEREYLEDRLVVLRSLAARMCTVIESSSGAQDGRKAAILSLIHNNIRKRLRLEDAAAAVYLSPSRTGHLIKELFKETFPQLVAGVKMREAARLLTTTRLGIAEVAWSVGYRDENYFSSSFKKVHKMTPCEFRRRNRAKA